MLSNVIYDFLPHFWQICSCVQSYLQKISFGHISTPRQDLSQQLTFLQQSTVLIWRIGLSRYSAPQSNALINTALYCASCRLQWLVSPVSSHHSWCQKTVRGECQQDWDMTGTGGEVWQLHCQPTHWPHSSIQVVSTRQGKTTVLTVFSNLVMQRVYPQGATDQLYLPVVTQPWVPCWLLSVLRAWHLAVISRTELHLI